jgi:hypothetical protein
MQTFDAPVASGTPTQDRPATQAHKDTRARSLAFVAGTAIVPIAVGSAVSALTRSRRAGWIAGGLGMAAFTAIRWQLARWFTEEPAYMLERRIGELEIRHYAPRIEAQTRLTVPDFETALDEGFRRLAKYLFGANDRRSTLAMTAPVLTIPRATTHTVAFVMPPGMTLDALPRPADERVQLVHAPARRVAVLRFAGRYNDDVMLEQTRRLHELVTAADLDVRGQPVFAGFDPPTTLPFLRRSELWIELA